MNVLNNAKNLYKGIESGDYVEAINTYAVESYKQHSTGVKTGRSGFIDFFDEFTKRCPERKFTNILSISEGDYAFMYVLQNINGINSWLTMDIFKGNEEAKIVEHWDIIESYEGVKQQSGDFEIAVNNNNLTQIVYENEFNLAELLSSAKNNSNNNAHFNNAIIHKTVEEQNFIAILLEHEEELMKASMLLIRFEEDQAVEYWHTMEDIPSPEVAKNSGKF